LSVAHVEELLEGLDDRALEAVRALLDLYGEGLARFADIVAEHDDGTIAAAVAGDDAIAQLLLVHGLHPVPLAERVRAGLEEVRPYLESHGGGVELLGVEDRRARLRLHGSCDGCPSSAVTLKLAIETAVLKAAPDLEGLDCEEAAPAAGALLQIELRTPGIAVGGAGPLVQTVGGRQVLFARVDGVHYAYRPACPGCGASLASATLSGGRLACTSCDARFDVLDDGRCLTDATLRLEPVLQEAEA
jgi:Fe-S cluster biogenesis protein NfuA